jgi:hypothetical protein
MGTAKYFDDAVHDLASGDDDLDAEEVSSEGMGLILLLEGPQLIVFAADGPRADGRRVELGRRSDDFIKKIHRSFGRNQ